MTPGPASTTRPPRPDLVIAAVLADMGRPGHRGVIVDSPPGAGKTTLVVRAAAELAASGEPCIIVAQTNNQVDDLTIRLAAPGPGPAPGQAHRHRLHSPGSPAHAAQRHRSHHGSMTSPPAQVILATAAKWATVKDRSWGWAIIDEAYQMRSDMLLLIADRFERALFVGDPGQLDPFSIIETPRWIGLPYDPMQNAVTVLQAHNPDLPVHRLPVSWRLPPSAAPVISGAFYPFSGFRAATAPGTRHLEFTAAGIRSSADATLDLAARTGWALHELPARHTIRTDPEAADAAAGLAARLLARQADRDMRTASRRAAAQPAGHRDRSHPPRPGRPDPPGPRPDHPGRRRDDQGRHRQPAAGRRIRGHHHLAPAVRAARRDSLPPGSRPPVRPRIPPPPRLHRRRPRRDSRPARRPPLRRAHPPRRPRQVPRRLGGEPRPARPPRRPPGTTTVTSHRICQGEPGLVRTKRTPVSTSSGRNR